jgi:hypothetical protein
VHSIVDRSLLMIPGLQTLADVLACSAPDRGGCIRLLESGRLVGVAPGGGKQAMLGMGWARRRGYAVAAVTARAPVIAMYTENLNLAYSTTSFSWPFSYLLYLSTRIAIAPVYGGLPVQLKSKLAKPVSTIPSANTEHAKTEAHILQTCPTLVTVQAEKVNQAFCKAMETIIGCNHGTDKTHLQAMVSWVKGDVDLSQTRLVNIILVSNSTKLTFA